GLALARLGFKAVFALGVLGYLVRCLLLAAVPQLHGSYEVERLVVGTAQAMHGICVACFWAAAFIYVDRVAGPEVRGSMQTFFGTFVFGIGMIVGAVVGGVIGAQFSMGSGATAVRNWTAIWLAPAAVAALTLLGFLLRFPRRPDREAEPQAAA